MTEINLASPQEFKDKIFNMMAEYNGKPLNLMISGGSILECFNDQRYGSLDTKQWNIYSTDERWEEKHSNWKAAECFLRYVNGKEYPINRLTTLEQSATAYEETLKKIIQIDICVLGIGENGHICSLWPNSKELESTKLVVAVDVPADVSPKRITVTLRFLNEFVKRLCFVIPPKNDKSSRVKEPDSSIRAKLKNNFDIYVSNTGNK